MRIVWAPLAIERVRDIAAYTATHNPEGARQWAEDLFEAVGHLSQFPELGRMVPELGRHELREMVWREYRVIYRLDPDLINILALVHGRQHLDPSDLS